jgi:hypothetical protein
MMQANIKKKKKKYPRDHRLKAARGAEDDGN